MAVTCEIDRKETLMKMIYALGVLAIGALAAAPIAGAEHKTDHSPGSKFQTCKKPTVKKAFIVKGILDAPPAGSTVDITVTGANRHARRSGEIADQDPTQRSEPISGADYMVDSAGAKLKLSGYKAGEGPEAGDKVRIVGKISLTKKKCAEDGVTADERYGKPNLKKVKIIDQG